MIVTTMLIKGATCRCLDAWQWPNSRSVDYRSVLSADICEPLGKADEFCTLWVYLMQMHDSGLCLLLTVIQVAVLK